jgi:hypothetical protein
MNWFSISNGLPGSGILSLATQGSKVYASTAGIGDSEVYYSSNRGENWIKISTGQYFGQIWSLVLADTSLFVASMGLGIFLTQDNGITWTWVKDGLTNLNVRSLYVTDNNYLFAGTRNGFVCKRPLSEMITGIGEQLSPPSVYTLSQNYPNPFNPSTKIKYKIPELTDVELKIYNVLGSEVITLVNETRSIGIYEVDFIATGLQSGIYFYRLQAGSFVETKKMVLMK